jgi:hypothetical protein
MKIHLLLAPLLVACATTSPPSQPQPDSTLLFTPSEIDLERFAAQCGVPDPAFQTADLYSLSLLGSDETPRSVVSFSFHSDLPKGTAIPVKLAPFGIQSESIGSDGSAFDVSYGQSGTMPGEADNGFSWSQGANTSELDSNSLTSVTLTVIAQPEQDKGEGTYTVRMVFSDGGIFDVVVGAALFTDASGCPAG